MERADKWIDRFLGLALALVFLINVVPVEAMTSIGKTKYNGYAVSIIRNDDEQVVTEYAKKNQVYSLTMDKETSECELQTQTYPVAVLGFRFGEPEIANYTVKIKQYDENGVLIANVTNKDNPSETYNLDDSHKVEAQMAMSAVIAGGLGAYATALLYAALATAATIVVAGTTYYVADQVISKLKQRQSSRVHYYKAYRTNTNVYIGPKLSDAAAVQRLKWRNGGNVFAISEYYAYTACAKASPYHRYVGPENSGLNRNGTVRRGYYWHYHPVTGYRGRNPQHGKDNHCFYI